MAAGSTSFLTSRLVIKAGNSGGLKNPEEEGDYRSWQLCRRAPENLSEGALRVGEGGLQLMVMPPVGCTMKLPINE